MAQAEYKCQKCGKTSTISFKAGQKPTEVKCECGEVMTRVWKNLERGQVVDPFFVDLSQSALLDGQDKKVL